VDEISSGPKMASVSLGMTVVCLYAFFVIMVAFGFGSYIFRTGWKVDGEVVGDGSGLLSIDNHLYILKNETDIRRTQKQLAFDMQLYRKDVSELDSKIAQSFAAIAAARAALQAEVDDIMADLVDFQYDLPGKARTRFEYVVEQFDAANTTETGQPENLSIDHRVRTLLQVASEGFESADADLDTKDRFATLHTRSIDALDTLSNAHTDANATSHNLQAQRKLTQARLVVLQETRDGLDGNLNDLQAMLPVGSPARARLSLLSLNIPFTPEILMRLVSFPTIFLTMIVTIAAGGLGTVVAFSRRYYSSTAASSLTLSRLFVNVGEGIAAAIAIFLFSGAGMLALTQGGGSANDVELSPYTVAFIAFLSGFMAEDAFAAIQAAGKRIFNQNDPNAQAEQPPEEPPAP